MLPQTVRESKSVRDMATNPSLNEADSELQTLLQQTNLPPWQLSKPALRKIESRIAALYESKGDFYNALVALNRIRVSIAPNVDPALGNEIERAKELAFRRTQKAENSDPGTELRINGS